MILPFSLSKPQRIDELHLKIASCLTYVLEKMIKKPLLAL